jgi:tRNA threonylcarbamoyladenosine biosynthesis protein TsaB
MIILSADTSSDRFSLALLRDNTTIARFKADCPQRQSSDMLPEIENLLSENSLDIHDIDLFCIGLGPGSFTGLRIGITIMRALAFSTKKPIVGVLSIDAIAGNAHAYKNNVCVIIDAKQQKLYARFYEFMEKGMRPRGKVMLAGIKEILDRVKNPILFLGDGIDVYKDKLLDYGLSHESMLTSDTWYPDAATIGSLAKDKMEAKGGDNVFTLSPFYVYPRECQIKRKNPRGSAKKNKINQC